ncbi:MAG: MXAN_6640 family putative metalloprotease [Melioribacteraceae bacterium]
MKKFFAFLIMLCGTLTAQNLDSLYSEFLRVKGIYDPTRITVQSEDTEPVKCGTSLVNNIKLNFNNFTAKQKSVLTPLLQRPATDTSFVTPSGKFRIHFDKSGYSIPGYDLKEFAKAADSSYNYEVNILKYPAPPADYGSGGDDLYDIYLKNLAGDEYGSTYPEQELGGDKFTSFVIMDNDFSGSSYSTNGIAAARVTIAHELHHAIQMGNYIYRLADRFYHEATSTAMEEFVFDDVNDYYAYINHKYFDNPSKQITAYEGYGHAILNIFLRDRLGISVIKEIWEAMPKMRAVEAFSTVLARHNTSLKVEFNLFGLWCYFTGNRYVPGNYFEEAANYPLIKTAMSVDFVKPTTTLKIYTSPITNNFYEFIDGNNRLFSIISNVDVQSSVNSPSTSILLDYSISSTASSGFRKLANNYYSKISASDLTLLAETNILNNAPLNPNQVSVETSSYPYPQPFKYSEHQYLYLPASLNGGSTADLYVYTPDMSLVYSGQKRIVATEKIALLWDAKDSNQNKLATGVYFYIVKSGDDTIKGKFVIYND